MQAIKQFFKTHPHAWWGAYLPVYLAMFFTIEHFITDNYWATQTVLDTYIPFCEWFIFPYVSWSPLLVALGRDAVRHTHHGLHGVCQAARGHRCAGRTADRRHRLCVRVCHRWPAPRQAAGPGLLKKRPAGRFFAAFLRRQLDKSHGGG